MFVFAPTGIDSSAQFELSHFLFVSPILFTYLVFTHLWECKRLHLLLTNQRLSIAPYVLVGLVHLCWGTCGADCV